MSARNAVALGVAVVDELGGEAYEVAEGERALEARLGELLHELVHRQPVGAPYLVEQAERVVLHHVVVARHRLLHLVRPAPHHLHGARRARHQVLRSH